VKIKLIICIIILNQFLFGKTRLSVQTHLSSFGVSPREFDIETIDAMETAGISWVRHWMIWHQVEYDSAVYDWIYQDSIINAYNARNIEVYITLMGGNQFYDPETTTYNFSHPEIGLAPTPGSFSMQGWLSFVEAAVNRYSNVVNYWSIWNEPNLEEYWHPEPNPGHYSYMVAVTSDKIKSIDPQAKVIGSNTSMIDLSFFSQIADSILPYIDYVGYHPYRLYPEDDQQNFLPVPFPPEDSLYSFEEEISALIDSIRLRDSTGRIGIWDDESGYPSHDEVIFWGSIYSSETTQAKYLLRKYLLSLAFFSEVTTWWCDFDNMSLQFNVLGASWFTDFYQLQPNDWLRKEVLFLFNYIGITYSPNTNCIIKEAEDYDSLFGWFEDSVDYICTPNSAPFDPGTYAVYKIPVIPNREYTVWTNLRNPNISKTPWIAVMMDSLNSSYYIVSTVDTSEVDSFIWTTITDSELLRVSYWDKGSHFFSFNSDTINLYIVPGIGGTQIDKILLKELNNVSEKKLAYNSLSILSSVFQDYVIRDTTLIFNIENITLSPDYFNEIRIFPFIDTISGFQIIPFWIGVEAVDNFPDNYINLSILKSLIDSIILKDLLTGVENNISFYYQGDSIKIDSLIISDNPKILILKSSTGVYEQINSPINSIFYNYFLKNLTIDFTVQSPSNINLSIFDISGRNINNFSNYYNSGNYSINHSLSGLTQGLYIYKIQINNTQYQGKVSIIR